MNIEGARDVLMGVMQDSTPVEHRDVLRNNLEQQRVQVEEEIMVLEGKLALKKSTLQK